MHLNSCKINTANRLEAMIINGIEKS